MPVSSLRIFMLKGTEKVQFQPFNPRNAFICLPFQFCLRQLNVNIKWHLTNFMSGCACFYLLVLQLKKLSRELNSDDIIILSEGVIP